MPESDYSKAVFNPAFERLKMMCRALDCCSQGRVHYDAHTWYVGLIDLFMQIRSKLSSDEKKKLDGDDKEKGLLKEVASIIGTNSNKRGYKMNIEVFNTLSNLEIYLRDCMEKHNLGIPDASDPNFAIYKQ